MIEPRGGRGSELVIWAAAEARRLRRNPVNVKRGGEAPARGRGPDDTSVKAPAAMLGRTIRPPEPGQFAVDANVDGDRVVLRLFGELDCDTAPLLRHALDDMRGRAVSTVVFDMAGLKFVDSRGLNELVLELRRQQEAGSDVLLQNPSPQTMRLLDIVGLSQVFIIA